MTSIGKVNISKDFSDYRSLSLLLYSVLEDIGVSAEVRDVNVKIRKTQEILRTLCSRVNGEGTIEVTGNFLTERSGFSEYICGSFFEGTSTEGRRTDIDIVQVQDHRPVVEDIEDACQHNHCLLMVRDSYTAPGYIKLQIVDHSIPLFRSDLVTGNWIDTDKEDRKVYIIGSDAFPPNAARHGPAYTFKSSENIVSNDFVYAKRCRKWPNSVSEWLTRQRLYSWPSNHVIAKCKTLGCFFVPVGHPYSDEANKEWRFSFSLQERMLVSSFNSVQLKCYVLMKIINSDIIGKLVGEESISSYHCKTCMLYIIENTPAEFWVAENLLDCLCACFDMLLLWLKIGVCPNYFIPGENMFDGRIPRQIRTKLQGVLTNILSAPSDYLLTLETDDVGDRLQQAITEVQGPWTTYMYSTYNVKVKLLLDFIGNGLLKCRNFIFRSCRNNTSVQEVCQELLRINRRVQHTEIATEHTLEEIREAYSMIIPFIDVSLASLLVVTAKHLGKSDEFILSLLLSDRWNQMSSASDSFSPKLKQASLLYMTGHFDISLGILNSLEHNLRGQLSVCGCRSIFSIISRSDLQESNAREMLRHHVVPCVVHLPAECEMTPTALNYEMLRSVCFTADDQSCWYNWSVVDGKVLLYFLLFLNHHHLDMEANALVDIENIKWIIKNDNDLGHRETALNLLGWIYNERGLVKLALECFEESISYLETPNAAFWHVKDIKCESAS